MKIDHATALETATRLRRSTTNRDTLTVCDALLERLVSADGESRKRAPNGTFDRKTYMREYMRKHRAADKAANRDR